MCVHACVHACVGACVYVCVLLMIGACVYVCVLLMIGGASSRRVIVRALLAFVFNLVGALCTGTAISWGGAVLR